MSDGFKLGNGMDLYHQTFPETEYLIDAAFDTNQSTLEQPSWSTTPPPIHREYWTCF